MGEILEFRWKSTKRFNFVVVCDQNLQVIALIKFYLCNAIAFNIEVHQVFQIVQNINRVYFVAAQIDISQMNIILQNINICQLPESEFNHMQLMTYFWLQSSLMNAKELPSAVLCSMSMQFSLAICFIVRTPSEFCWFSGASRSLKIVYYQCALNKCLV